MTTVAQNIVLLERWYREVWREGKNETIYELLAPNAVLTGQRGSQTVIRGAEEFVKFAEEIRSAFPDTEVVMEDAFGDGDKVAARWTATMTHTGEGLGMPPTGKKVKITGISVARIIEGKIVEGWDNWDQLAMLEQIGAYAAPDAVILAKTA
jgi:steroid delta-isomerase-like uncharacterized protein